MIYKVPSMGYLSIDQLANVVNTHVGSVLSRYIMELMPAIKIASRPSQPAASRRCVLQLAISASKCVHTFEDSRYQRDRSQAENYDK